MNLYSQFILLLLSTLSVLKTVAGENGYPPPGTDLCLPYTTPADQEVRHHLYWDRINGIDTKGIKLMSSLARGGFRKLVDDQDVEFSMSYTVSQEMEGAVPVNTVRLNNYPTLDSVVKQRKHQFIFVWNVDGKPWKKWWSNSNTKCMAIDNDYLSDTSTVDSIEVYKRVFAPVRIGHP